MDLPEDLKNKEVEIIVFPHEKHNNGKNKHKNAKGILEKYKNEKLASFHD